LGGVAGFDGIQQSNMMKHGGFTLKAMDFTIKSMDLSQNYGYGPELYGCARSF